MSKRNAGIILFIIIAAIAGFYYWQSLQGPSQQMGGRPPSVIAATTVEQVNWKPSLQSVGSLTAENDILISTEVNGIISEIVFASGQPVNKGDVLLKLDDSVDQAALDALRADQHLAEVQFKRAKGLLQKRVTSQSEYDEASARYDAARARVKQQEAIIKRKVIVAPFSGDAGIRYVSLGQFIEAGQPIVSLQSMDPIYVDYTLAERYLNRLKVGQQVQVKVDAMPDTLFEGSIIALNSGIDKGTRSLKVRAQLANPDGLLRAGMFANVNTITGEPQSALALPRTAISFNTYGNFVYVIQSSDKGMTVKRTPVETGEVRNGMVIIKGLDEGTQVVRAGLVKLREGMAVKIDNQIPLNDAEISGE